MGSQIVAKCKCGLKATSFIGGNMSNFKTTQYFPALCAGCSNVVQVNVKSDAPRCPKCSSTDVMLYNDASLIDMESLKEAGIKYDLESFKENIKRAAESLGSEYQSVAESIIAEEQNAFESANEQYIDIEMDDYHTVAQSFDLKLFDCRYKCPSCGEYALRFFSTGLFTD